MNIYNDISEIVGRTPLLKLKTETKANVLAKLEFVNPAGSSKDRVAKFMIDEAEKSGLIKKDTVIIEPTSGNTGIGLAALAAARGYKTMFVMPNTMSIERINILKAYGAEVILTAGSEGMQGAVKKAEEISKEIKNSFIAGQFENPANPKAHYNTTGPEIWEDTEGNVDIFIAAVGTGGTLSGAGNFLKEKNPNIKVIAVEPASSPLLSKGVAGAHKIQGIGANFVPKTLDTNVYDDIITVTDDNAYKTGRELAKKQGILVGISAGAAVWAAVETAKKPENAGKNIVVIIPDTGGRYFSTQGYFTD